ncbi:hypothetical protein DRO54_07960 [Candidatus Bathyarchaeota archaeon]|nr:MAG: hypothetical protein DRO54_07960 [Candidatus Bathyarchaeota archaeon]
MNPETLNLLCCPICHGDLTLRDSKIVNREIVSGVLKCQLCERSYRIADGVPDFLVRELLSDEDRKWMLEYDNIARTYDILMEIIIPSLSLGLEPLGRYNWAKQLNVKKGACILDVATGTGRNIPFLLRQVGLNGKIVAMDISKRMLAYARAKIRKKRWGNVELQRADASNLPYKDNTFDAVIHVGGINTFGKKRKALQEMTRVAKSNARIVIVDEGLSPEKEETFLGKFLIKTNALYRCKPPIKLLPKNVKNVKVKWNFNLLWPHYNMEFIKKS